ncbi:MAG: hypothetical protein AAF567_09245 [Actinomycetota bacterium]
MSDPTEPVRPPSDGADRPATSRTVLGALLALLILAVVLALWAIITRDDDPVAEQTSTTPEVSVPTALPIPTSTPAPAADEPTAVPVPTATPTPVPEGFEACGEDRAPLLSATYIVDTISTPLNQRSEPSVDGELVGAFDPGQTGLSFNGDCVVNLADGFVWWQIDTANGPVWVASSFVTAS